jgi:type VI secretion system secreted protein VgrG
VGTYTQVNRPIQITTPLGKDVLLLTGFQGHEGISRLFHFRLDLLAERSQAIPFDRVVGQNVTVDLVLPSKEQRFFNGIVNRFTQGRRDDEFTHFRADLVPQLWLWTKRVQSRIFQHLSVPKILEQVLTGLDVRFDLQESYHPRDYCVQYRESDFAFASRLMEEEGIRYYFEHKNGSHQLVLTDVASKHPDLPGQNTVIYEEVVGGERDELRIVAWEKTQELRSGKYTLWDHCFELPGKNLEARQPTLETVVAGTVTHRLKLGGNEQLEIYDYPGRYAQRFDGVDKGGTDQPAEVPKIFADNKRTVKIRMEQETLPSLEVHGVSNCGHFVPGYQFKLARHFDADGPYVLGGVEHSAHLTGNFRSGEDLTFAYENRFSCVPAALPYRPLQTTPRPIIPGTQTATVVGPHGEEIFCDKYGRVKAQFHWDRQGKKDTDSSCWVRVAQFWAGKGWGAFFWPRIGHEVVVAFEEGDPDRPLIIGSVYNAENMPPFALPQQNMLGGIKSASVRGQAHENYNGIVFDDEKGREHLSIHSERHLSFNSELDKLFNGRHKVERVSGMSLLTVGNFPGGGGSGGGPDPYLAYGYPQATGFLGLNGQVVYGENLQAAFGLNHQIAFGSNLQMCINPMGLAAGTTGAPGSSLTTAFLGSGVGGNMQLTVGTSTNLTLGRNISINLGPAAITVDPGKEHPDTTAFLTVLSYTYGLWLLVYGILHSDRSATNAARCVLTGAAQVVIDACLHATMQSEMSHYLCEKEFSEILEKDVFAVRNSPSPYGTGVGEFCSALAALTSIVVPAAACAVTAARDKG